jgi:hypothetical protein
MKDLSGVPLVLLVTGVTALSVCLGSSIALFLGSIETGAFRTIFLVASLVWFTAAGWLSRRRSEAS